MPLNYYIPWHMFSYKQSKKNHIHHLSYHLLTTFPQKMYGIDLPTIPAVPSSAGLAPGSATNPPSLRKREAA